MRIFLALNLFLLSSAFATSCGLEGSVEERIKHCAITKGKFALIAEVAKGREFYKDMSSGLIWGNRIPTDFNQYGSQMACSIEVSGYEIMSSLKWRLPTIRELEDAAAQGMKAALPDTAHAYWSSTQVKTRKSYRRKRPLARVYLWDGSEEKTDVGDLKDAASVRCVARE